MSISRGTLQKALQLNRASFFFYLLILLPVFVLLVSCGDDSDPAVVEPSASPEPSAVNEEAESSLEAVLQDGPDERFGILLLPANAIRHYEGIYEHNGYTIIVRYTTDDVILPDNWVTRRCGTVPLRFTLENGAVHYAYLEDGNWVVFFEIADSYENGCSFIERFLQRLRYFKSVTDNPETVPFPAIVEIR